jgi:UDP-N-acetylmuramate: L-alanyl-gamma-D-glutamyl-meso-diaminopimelate ligase
MPGNGEKLEIHLVAIGGTGMAPLACLLKDLGHRVRGSDGPLYPPMSTLLEEAGIVPMVGYDPAHLEPRPDLVIIGNAVTRDNPEAAAAREFGLPQLSMPQALGRYLLADRRPLVIAGTHGKTTTTTMASWVYTSAGADPGYLIGGLPKNLEQSFRVGSGERFIIEGDEYNASYFDRGPKFLHYRPQTLILTSAEYDHADLYPSPESLRSAYARLIALLPADGLLVACGDTAEVRQLAAEAPCEVVLYGLGEENDLWPRDLEATAEGSRFRVDGTDGEVEVHLAVPGEHNLLNALAVFAAARHDALPLAEVVGALGSFAGVRRRLETLGTARGIAVVDDFAHHPTAVEKSLGGLRQAYPERRLIILFEPRSLTAGRAMFQDAYRQAFRQADVVLFAPVFYAERLGEDERLDLPALCRSLGEQGVDARVCESVDAVRATALDLATEGDVLATMSSGAFGGMPHRLLEALSGE